MVIAPRRHQAFPRSTNGSIATVGLLNIASTNSPRERKYGKRGSVGVGVWGSVGVSASSNQRYARMLARKNSMDRVFFCSVIQATEATLTGWTAQIRAA